MSPLTFKVAAAVGVRLHRPRRGRPCEFAGHDYPTAAVDRHGTGVKHCPECAQPIPGAEPLMNGMVRIPTHDRLSSICVRVVAR